MPRILPNVRICSRARLRVLNSVRSNRRPHTGQLAIDKAAASRFIKNAIAQAKDTIPTSVSGPSHVRPIDEDGDGKARAHDVLVPAKQTEKMLEREKYHEALREEALLETDDDDHLEVIDNNDGEEGKGKPNPVDSPMSDVPPPSSTAVGKQRRPPIDPFAGLCGFPGSLFPFTFLYAGYGDGQNTRSSAASAETGPTPRASRSGAKNRKIHKEDVSAEASSGANTPSGVESVKKSRKPRKNAKK